jgi:undecaprenyl-diphosphatase
MTIEKELMSWVGTLTGKSMFADSTAMLLLTTDFLKGAPFALGLLLTWIVPYEQTDQKKENRIDALRMLIVVLLAVLSARIAQHFFYSPRPIMVEEIGIQFSSMAKSVRLDWNSFPSDHMTLYFPIALMVSFKNRGIGIALMIWSVLGVALPRIFFGRHYPSDVLGGMVIGSLIVGIVWSLKNKIDPTLKKISDISENHPKISITLAFMICFQIATVFDGARWILLTFKNICIYYYDRYI